MVTLASFSDMLTDYLHYEMLSEELKLQSWFINQVEKDQNWRGGPLQVPFEGAQASSIAFGGMVAEADITEFDYVRGEVSGYKEVWGSMIWNAKDLIEHVPASAREKGYINKQSFLKNIHGQLKTFITSMKEAVSLALLAGAGFAKLTADATANDGAIVVNRPERFKIGQKVVVDDTDVDPITAWVKSININTKTIVLVTTKGGATLVDFSANTMTVAKSATVYREGANTSTNTFTSLRNQLLSAANGGGSSIAGVSKLLWPHLQAIQYDGSSMSATNVLSVIFDAWTTIKTYGKGNATDVVCSYKHLGSVMKQLEVIGGPYRHVETKVSAFGYTEVTVFGVEGQLKIVGVQEMDDDLMYVLDWSAFKLHSNGFFEHHVDPDGKKYYTTRTAGAGGGYKYICDIRFFGELVVHTPAWCGVIHSISY